MYQSFPSTLSAQSVFATSTKPRVPVDIGHAAQTPIAELARLLQIDADALGAFAADTFTTRRVKPGDALLRAGDRFESLYIVRSGFFKTVTIDPAGGEQVLGFPMIGDVIGIDGIDSAQHQVEVSAIEHAEVVIVPFNRLARMAKVCPALENIVYRTLSRELVREQRVQWMLGSLGAEARVAAFLLNLADRFGKLGYSRASFNLRMTREEIGSYLGLTLETVSRALSAFAAAGSVQVHGKSIEIRRPAALQALVDGPSIGANGAGRARAAA